MTAAPINFSMLVFSFQNKEMCKIKHYLNAMRIFYHITAKFARKKEKIK